MKLYTEQQVIKAALFSLAEDATMEKIFDSLTPIELPTDDDIEKEFTIGETIYTDCIKGAKYVIEQIKKQK